MSNLDLIRGRSTVLNLANQSGSARTTGDVVVIDTANTESFTTWSSSSNATGRAVGVVDEAIGIGSNGRVVVEGYARAINSLNTVSRGDYLYLSTTAAKAGSSLDLRGGAFGQIIKPGSGTTPAAVIFPVAPTAVTVSHASNTFTGPVTLTTPDNTVGITSPAVGTLALTSVGAGGAASTAVAAARYVRSSGDYTTSSATFTDLDTTNMNLTITTAARRVLLLFSGAATVNNTAGTLGLDFTVDGARVGGDFGLQVFNQHSTASELIPVSIHYLTNVLTAGSHTFKVQWRVANGAHTGSILGSTSSASFAVFSVLETAATA